MKYSEFEEKTINFSSTFSPSSKHNISERKQKKHDIRHVVFLQIHIAEFRLLRHWSHKI